MSIRNVSGLELMQAMVDGQIPMPPIAHVIPMRGVAAEHGRIVFEAQADERHLNPLGGVHGGFAATVLDSVTGCAVHTVLEAGVGYATVDLNVKMLKAVPRGVPLIAEGKVIFVSRSLGISEGTLKDAGGNLYAHATATCLILRPT
ncbi:MAG: PaaI family thioesterase [Candidatus Promineofilum sp.]|nr:PaaI family thioesterase [Promineifilum sp.]